MRRREQKQGVWLTAIELGHIERLTAEGHTCRAIAQQIGVLEADGAAGSSEAAAATAVTATMVTAPAVDGGAGRHFARSAVGHLVSTNR